MNYNEDGINYAVYRQDVGQGIGGYMPDRSIKALLTLITALNNDAKHQEHHGWISEYLGAIHHLEGLLLAVENIVEQLNYLQSTLLSPEPCVQFPKTIIKRDGHDGSFHTPPALIGISSKRIELEAETALLKASSTVERLKGLVDTQCQLGGVYYFHKLSARLQEKPEDPRSAMLLDLIAKVLPVFTKTILPMQGTKDSLRNAIAHRASSPELMDKAFTINWLEDGRLLAFDAEYGKLPLVGTMRELAKAVPFFALKTFKLLLARAPSESQAKLWSAAQELDVEEFEPIWRNPFIHYSKWVDPTEQGPVVSVLRWLPGGFQAHMKPLKPEVLSFAVRPVLVE